MGGTSTKLNPSWTKVYRNKTPKARRERRVIHLREVCIASYSIEKSVPELGRTLPRNWRWKRACESIMLNGNIPSYHWLLDHLTEKLCVQMSFWPHWKEETEKTIPPYPTKHEIHHEGLKYQEYPIISHPNLNNQYIPVPVLWILSIRSVKSSQPSGYCSMMMLLIRGFHPLGSWWSFSR